MHRSLAVARKKVERAEARIDELIAEGGVFFGDEPHHIPGKYDHETKRFSFFFQPREVPPIMDVLVGEAAHALRSALNNLVSALGGTSEGDTDFPIFMDEIEYMRRGMRKIRLLSPFHQSAIYWMQPFNHATPRDAPLAILNRLAREDKHRASTFKLAAYMFGDLKFSAVQDIDGYGEVVMHQGRMEPGDPLAIVEVIPSGPKPELHIEADFRASIAYGEGWLIPHPFPRLIKEVRDILDAFATTAEPPTGQAWSPGELD